MPDLETPDEDAVEQQQPVAEVEVDVEQELRPEVDEGDLAESSREVLLDEDDYR
jgi:hypothetical protein